MKNEKFDAELRHLVESNPKGFNRLLIKNKNYSHLKNYIEEQTPLLNDSRYKLVTRIYWIIHGIESFDDPILHCRECGRMISDNPRFKLGGYGSFCSLSCTNKNKDRRKRAVETSLRRFGKGNGNNRRKAKDTCVRRYGVGFYTGTNEFKEKSRKTLGERYGVDNVMEVPEIREKIKSTKFERYGDVYYNNPSKQSETIKNRTNERWDEIKEKTNKTCLMKYGSEWSISSENNRNKSRKTCLEHFGVEYAMQNPKVLANARKRYFYDGLNFDSKPEVAIYIYCKDNFVDFQYKPGISFEFDCDGITRHYCPDFIIEGKVVEVKGDQFFDNDGNMVCPFTKNLDDESRKKLNTVYEAKYLCMIKHGVIILTSKDYSKYLRYVKEKYGKDFLDKLKKKV